MTNSSPQPQPQWVFAPKPRPRVGRVILLVALAIIAVGVAVAAVMMMFRQDAAKPAASPSPTASSASPTATPTKTPSPAPSASTTATPTPSATTAPTAAPVPTIEAPDFEPFKNAVAPVLRDAGTGLGMVASMEAAEAASVVDGLVLDAQNLWDRPAPDGITSQWRSAVGTYLGTLETLRNAVASDGDVSSALGAARDALSTVNSVVN